MKLHELGEDEMVRRFVAMFRGAEIKRAEIEIAAGEDDAASWRWPGGYVVASSDLAIEGVHFDLGWESPEDAGWRAMVMALGDMAAKGAFDLRALVSMALPPPTDWEIAAGLGRGLAGAAAASGCAVMGGDVSTTAGPMVIDIAALGRRSSAPLPRSAVRAGWWLGVTGALGAPASARLSRRALRLLPCVEEGARLNELGLACGDISDGLVREAHKFAAWSGCRALIRSRDIPVADGATIEQALAGGDEVELVVAGPAHLVAQAHVHIVGELVAGSGVLVDGVQPAWAGYRHFG